MPCYDHRSSPSYINEHTVKPLQERADLYARWLCLLLRDKTEAQIAQLPDGLREWWREHRLADERRS